MLISPNLLIIKKLRATLYDNKETSQLILKAKSVDWFLYDGNIEN